MNRGAGLMNGTQYRHSDGMLPEDGARSDEHTPQSRPQSPPVAVPAQESSEQFIPLTRRWTCEGLSEQGRIMVSKSSDSVQQMQEPNRHHEPQSFKRELHKASMVDELCREVAEYISRMSKKYDERQVLAHVQDHFRALPSKYALTVSVEDTVAHMRLMAETRRTGGYAVHVQQHKENPAYAIITITSVDRPKLYNKITHVLDQLTTQTIEADVVTSKNGTVLDRFTVVLNAELRLQRLTNVAERLRSLLASIEEDLQVEQQTNDRHLPYVLMDTETVSDNSSHEDLDSSSHSGEHKAVIERTEQISSQEHTFQQMHPEDIQILEQLGEGPTTVTRKALHLATGEIIAIKQPHQNYQIRMHGVEEAFALQRELSIVVRLNHPNVCRFIGACVTPGQTYIAYEYLPGVTLTALVRDTSASFDILKLALDIAEGVAYLHDNQILHRDLKSGNVMLDAHGNAKIVDFGLSTTICSDQDMTAETGTYRWMAPEVIRHEPYSTAADVYSFGVVLWEMLAREQPYGDMLPIQAAYAVASFNLRPSMPTHTPPRVQALLRGLWNPDPSKRPSFRLIIPLLQEAFA